MSTLFSEKQTFRFFWTKLILIVIFLAIGGGAVRQVFWGIPFGNKPMSDVGIACLALFLGMLLLFAYSSNLKTRISAEGITVAFFPFLWKKRFIAWDTVQSAYVREYSPIREYGGWGFKVVNTETNKGAWGGNRAYNVSGNQGLQLVFKNGDKLLIGTQRPQEIQDVLKSIQTPR